MPFFPKLRELTYNSGNLSALPPRQTPLVKLDLENAPSIHIIPDYPKLNFLRLYHCLHIKRIPYLPALMSLYCHNSSLIDVGIVDLETYRKWRNMADSQINAIASLSRKNKLGPDLGGKHGLVKYLKPV